MGLSTSNLTSSTLDWVFPSPDLDFSTLEKLRLVVSNLDLVSPSFNLLNPGLDLAFMRTYNVFRGGSFPLIVEVPHFMRITQKALALIFPTTALTHAIYGILPDLKKFINNLS